MRTRSLLRTRDLRSPLHPPVYGSPHTYPRVCKGEELLSPGKWNWAHSRFSRNVIDKPVGVTCSQRKSSFIRALIYGRPPLSEKSGRRSLPTTRSTSSWAFCNTSGKRVIARKNVLMKDTVCTNGLDHYSRRILDTYCVSACSKKLRRSVLQYFFIFFVTS